MTEEEITELKRLMKAVVSINSLINLGLGEWHSCCGEGTGTHSLVHAVVLFLEGEKQHLRELGSPEKYKKWRLKHDLGWPPRQGFPAMSDEELEFYANY